MSHNPIHQIIDTLSEFCKRWEVCHQADTSAKRTETLQAWRSLKLPFIEKHRFPNEAFRALCDPALAWLTNHGFHNQQFIQTINQAVSIVVHLALGTPVAMPKVFANKEEAALEWERQLQMLEAAWLVKNQLRALAAQTGQVWIDAPGEGTSGLAVPRASAAATIEESAQEAPKSKTEATPAISGESRPDGPEAPYWLWTNGRRLRIGNERSRRPWQLLEYMWSRAQATFQELQGSGRPWCDDVEASTVSSTVNRLNNFLPADFPRRLAVRNHCLIWRESHQNLTKKVS